MAEAGEPGRAVKLVMTADAVGGVWTYALDLARGLRVHGVEAVLAVNGPPPSAPPGDVEVIATGLPLDWLADDPRQVGEAGAALARLAARERADLVQLNSPAYAADARFDAPVVGVQHSCPATWWRAVRGSQAWPADFAWRFDQARRGLSACAAVVAPSRSFAAMVQAEYGLSDFPVAVLNGRPPPPPAGPVPQEAPYVFTAGRLWDESKGMATLDAAAAGLATPVHAAGPLSAPGGGAAGFAHLHAAGVLAPADLSARMAGAAVFVSPSLYEPFGLAVLEAAQLARPLVLTDIATFRELWDGAAVFVPPRDARALTAALEALLADAPRRAALGAAARSRAHGYTVEAMAAGMVDVFARIELRRS